MTENRAEIELNTCSPQTPNNLFQHRYELRVDTRLSLRVVCFLRHQSPSPRTRPTLRGVAESPTLKPDFVAKKWQNEKNSFQDIMMFA